MTTSTAPASDSVLIRPASLDDIPQIRDIYAHYVTSSTCTLELEPPDQATMAKRLSDVTWMGGPYLVAQAEDGIAGYAYAGTYRPRPAYARTVENSIYLAPRWAGRGLGRRLLEQLIADCAQRGFAQMIAVIAGADNLASIHLHRSCGFEVAGRLQAVGWKFEHWIDTTLMQRAL